MKSIVPIHKDELQKVFRYDAEKNVLWRELKSGRMRVVNTSVVNTNSGYVSVRFIYRMIKVHRVIYTLVNGDIPEGMEVDHIDNDKSNNNISNLHLLSHGDNNAKSCDGLKPNFHKRNQSYLVQEQVKFGGKRHSFNFGSFEILSEAQELCNAYNAKFGYGKPLWDVRKQTPKYWKSCLQEFKDWYFNTKGG